MNCESTADRAGGPKASQMGVCIVAIAAAMLVLIPAVLLAASGHNRGRAAFDSIVYHERVIRDFIAQYPSFDLRNPLTSTTPGYHVAIATVGRFTSDDVTVLRIASSAFGAALVATVAAWCARRTSAYEGLLLAAPLACSIYVIGSAAWLLPDNAAWLLVVLTLAACLAEPWSVTRTAFAAFALLLLVVVRQSQVWAAAPVAVACLVNRAADGSSLTAARLLQAILAILPATAAVAAFAAVWGGLVPPRFYTDVSGANPATPAFVLLQFSIAGLAFLPWLWPSLRECIRSRQKLLATAAIIGGMAGAIPATTPDRSAGRFSGWWTVAERFPSIADHTNTMVLAGSVLGSVLIAASLANLKTRNALVIGSAILAFIAALSSTHYSWQRYHEPFVLAILAMTASMQRTTALPAPRDRGWKAAGVSSLCVILLLITARGLSEPEVSPGHPVPDEHLMPGESPSASRRSALS